MNTPTSCVPISILLNVWFYILVYLTVCCVLAFYNFTTKDHKLSSSIHLLAQFCGSVGPLPRITPGEIKAGSHLEYLGKNGTQFPVVMGLKVLFPQVPLWARCCLDPQGHCIYVALPSAINGATEPVHAFSNSIFLFCHQPKKVPCF